MTLPVTPLMPSSNLLFDRGEASDSIDQSGGPTTAERVVVLVAAGDVSEQAQLSSRIPKYYSVITVSSAREGEAVFASEKVAILIATPLLIDMNGLNWMAQVRRLQPSVMRILAATESTEELAIASVNVAGVFRYVKNPLVGDHLAKATDEAVSKAGHRVGPPCMREAVGETIKAHNHCRHSTTGCLVKAQEMMAPLPESLVNRLSSRVGWAGIAFFGFLIFMAAAMAVGFGVIVLLYIFKSVLGIDLIPDRHWTNWFS